MNEQLVTRIQQCPNLPSLPEIAVQVLDLAQKPDADIVGIARIISKDPALSGKILRTVNSSFYGRSQVVSTISSAMVILGLQSVKTLVLGFSLITHLQGTPTVGFKPIAYWKRSIYAATAARSLASRLGVVQQEEAFLAALLQDIGMLVLDHVLGEQYGRIHEKIQTHAELADAEQKALGMTHADAGGILAAQWKLPPLLAVSIACHHSLDRVTDPVLRKLAELAWLSGVCADVFVDQDAAKPIAMVRHCCSDGHGMSEVDCDAMLEEIGVNTKDAATLFQINIGSAGSFEDILNKANETLVQITLQSQQQASTLQQQASTLQQQNQQLREEAGTDVLTTLATRRRLEEFAAQQFSAAVDQGTPLSLLMLDIDKFKTINDQYGHPVGDEILRGVGALVASAARPHDLAARFGGEEMTLVLPGATKAVAAAVAESIRRAISLKSFSTAAGMLKVTVSIGVASFEPGMPLTAPAHLFRAADLALYSAKHSGRNRVRVFSLSKPAAGAAA